MTLSAETERQRNDRFLKAIDNGLIHTADVLFKDGADVRYAGDVALFGALKQTQPVTLAFLMEKGATVYPEQSLQLMARLKKTPGQQMRNFNAIITLLNAYDGLEALAKSYEGKAKTASIRALIYQAAIVGALTGLDAKQLVQFCTSSMQHNASDTELAETDPLKILDPAEMALLSRRAATQLDRLAQSIGIRGYQEAWNMRDMALEYANVVLLPKLLIETGAASKPGVINSIFPHSGWTYLSPYVTKTLFEGQRLDTMLDMGKSWQHNGLPDSYRPYVSDKWQAIIDDVPTPFTHENQPLVIRALATWSALGKEGKILNHCLGGSNYCSKCAEGRIHLLSLQTEGGVPIATAQIRATGNPQEPLMEAQLHGKDDGDALPVAREAMDWFYAKLKSGEISIRSPKGGKWGAVENNNPLPPLLQRVGYDPTPQRLAACIKHYETHVLVKRPRFKRRSAEGSFAQPARLEESYNWVSAMRTNPAAAPSDDWHALVTRIAADLGTTPILAGNGR